MTRKTFVFTVAAVAVAIVGAVAVVWSQQAQQTPRAGRGMRDDGPVPVIAAIARRADVPVYLDGVGTTRALNTVTVRPQVEGKLISVAFKEGQDVKRGDVLARIDPTTYQAQLDQVIAKKAQDEAQLANARLDLERYTRLAASNSIARQQVDTQKAMVAQLEAQVNLDQASIENTKAILAYTTITSPLDGRTGMRLVDEGNVVRNLDTVGIVVITQLQPISVLFTLPQQQIAEVNRAFAKGRLEVDAFGPDNKTVVDKGSLQVVDNQVDQTTGTIKLKAEFPNATFQLWPGQFVNVRLLVDTQRDVIVAPTAAVQRGPNGTFVFVVAQDSTVSVRPVTVSQQDETQAVISAGLETSERVVTTGFARLAAGTRVAVTNAEEVPAAGSVPIVEPRQRRPGGERRERRSEAELGQAAMSVSTPFIQRPIATSLLGVATMLGGLLGYLWLPVSSLPQVDFPTIQVSTQLPGASPDTMASLVTASLERQFGQIPSLAVMTSSSSFGISQITLQFDLNRDIDGAAQDVQAAINAAGSTLPRNLPYPPTYSKVNPADAPIVTLALTSDTIPLRELSDLADTLMAQRLSEVTGVGRVSIQGGVRPAVRIQADLSRLAAYGIGLEDVRVAIAGANVSGPKGALDGAHQSYTIASNDQLAAASQYLSMVVAYRNNAPVLLGDVAQVVDGLENDKVGGWYQGRPAVIIDVQRQPGANVIETVRRVNAELPRLQRAMPVGIDLTVVQDRTHTIRASIRDVQFTLVLSVVLVVLVVLAFLRTIRATIIAGVALPLSLVATFGVMWFCGFSLDNLSLMALTIGTGFVVDDAIVMIENIVRHIEKGESPMDAALRGAREIGFTVISLTLSLIAVFIPLLFMTGLVGRMFREFALTLTIAVIVSAIVSLTLTPMMCSKLLRHTAEGDGNAVTRFFNRGVDWTVGHYHRSLEWVLRHQTLTLLTTLVTLIATVWLYIVIPKGFLPSQDTGLITAVMEAGTEVSFAEMHRLQAEVEKAVRKDPDVAGVVSIIGVSRVNPTPNAGRLAITLKPREQRLALADAIVERLKNAVAPIPGMTVHFQSVQDIQISTRPSRAQYQYTLIGTSTKDVVDWSEKLADRLREDSRLREVASEAQEGGLRLQVDIDREKAGRLGVSMQAVNDTLNSAFGQRQISTIYGQSNQYRVILEAEPRYQSDPSSLSKLYVPGTGGVQVPLNAIARFDHVLAPLSIAHQEQFPSVTISFNLAPGAALSDAVAAVSEAQRFIEMPSSVIGTYSGDAAEFAKSLAGQPWLLLAAAVAIYIVLGVLYESFIHPMTILSTLPSAGVGALLALMLFGYDLSVVALIGIILLMGIVKKNAIMMIDFALEAERGQGMSPRDSIVQASLLRFRPIMMTTLAALFGAIPLAVESGTGSELRNPLGITIIGGLLLSQLLTLYTTPVIYLAMERMKQRFSRSRGFVPPVRRTPDAAPGPAE